MLLIMGEPIGNGQKWRIVYLAKLSECPTPEAIIDEARLCLPADGDREVEDGQHFGSSLLDEHVTDDCGRNGGVTGLANADDSSHCKEGTVVLKIIINFSYCFVMANHQRL